MKNTHWNKMFNLYLDIKRCYISHQGDLTKPFETWLEFLNNDVFNILFQPIEINQKDNFILLRYGQEAMRPGFWDNPDSIYRDCRSIVIDIERDELVLAPFKKFFNINELPETRTEEIIKRINQAKLVEFMNKLDGSAQAYRYYYGEVVGAGSRALDIQQSFRLDKGFKYLTDSHIQMFKDFNNYTFMFEFIDPSDVHVVDYSQKESGLYLIGMINNETGTEVGYSGFVNIARIYGDIKVVELENINLSDALAFRETFKANEKEGWVVNIDGYKIKIKCEDYVTLHKTLAHFNSTNAIIEAIAEEKFDDFMSLVPQAHKNRIEVVADKCFDYISLLNNKIDIALDELNNLYDNRKDFMIGVNQYNKILRRGIIAKYLRHDFHPLKQTHKYKKIHEIEKELIDLKEKI